jgi:hypothetical protein
MERHASKQQPKETVVPLAVAARKVPTTTDAVDCRGKSAVSLRPIPARARLA